jgi:hypothetical protein
MSLGIMRFEDFELDRNVVTISRGETPLTKTVNAATRKPANRRVLAPGPDSGGPVYARMLDAAG